MQITPSSTRISSSFRSSRRSTNPLRKRSAGSSSTSSSASRSPAASPSGGITKPSPRSAGATSPLSPAPPYSGYTPPSTFLQPLDSTPLASVLLAIAHIRSTLFTPLPDNFRGLPTPLIAPLLQFRESAPPYVPLPLLQASVSASPTAVSKELSELLHSGTLRRLEISSDTREAGVIPTSYLYDLISNSTVLDPELKQKFTAHLKANPTRECTTSAEWSPGEIRELMDAGFLVLTPPPQAIAASNMNTSSSASLVSSCAVHASGTEEAAGGSGELVPSSSSKPVKIEYSFSLPGLGRFLGVLRRARMEVRGMIPRKGGCAVKSLRERWDGQGPPGQPRERALGRLKKWKEFWGVGFDALVGEMLGRGDVEVWRAVGYAEWGIKLR